MASSPERDAHSHPGLLLLRGPLLKLKSKVPAVGSAWNKRHFAVSPGPTRFGRLELWLSYFPSEQAARDAAAVPKRAALLSDVVSVRHLRDPAALAAFMDGGEPDARRRRAVEPVSALCFEVTTAQGGRLLLQAPTVRRLHIWCHGLQKLAALPLQAPWPTDLGPAPGPPPYVVAMRQLASARSAGVLVMGGGEGRGGRRVGLKGRSNSGASVGGAAVLGGDNGISRRDLPVEDDDDDDEEEDGRQRRRNNAPKSSSSSSGAAGGGGGGGDAAGNNRRRRRLGGALTESSATHGESHSDEDRENGGGHVRRSVGPVRRLGVMDEDDDDETADDDGASQATNTHTTAKNKDEDEQDEDDDEAAGNEEDDDDDADTLTPATQPTPDSDTREPVQVGRAAPPKPQKQEALPAELVVDASEGWEGLAGGQVVRRGGGGGGTRRSARDVSASLTAAAPSLAASHRHAAFNALAADAAAHALPAPWERPPRGRAARDEEGEGLQRRRLVPPANAVAVSSGGYSPGREGMSRAEQRRAKQSGEARAGDEDDGDDDWETEETMQRARPNEASTRTTKQPQQQAVMGGGDDGTGDDDDWETGETAAPAPRSVEQRGRQEPVCVDADADGDDDDWETADTIKAVFNTASSSSSSSSSAKVAEARAAGFFDEYDWDDEDSGDEEATEAPRIDAGVQPDANFVDEDFDA